MEITINPLIGIVKPKPNPRASWMCKHSDAILINRKKWIYRCIHCNPTSGTITVVPRGHKKKATVSPSSSSLSLSSLPQEDPYSQVYPQEDLPKETTD
jgi:hypothetical protein